MAGQVQIVYDAETAPAVNELFKLAQAQKKVEDGGKKVAMSLGDVSKANMRVGREGQQASQSMIAGLRGTITVAGGAIAAIGAIAEAWAKATERMVQYRQKERDLAVLQDVKGLPALRRLVENPKYGRAVSDDTKFSLFAGLQSELGQEQALKSYKTVVEAGAIIPQAKAQEFGQAFSKIKSLRPNLNDREALNATLSVFQQLRGNLGGFDQKQVEKLLQTGLRFDQAVGTAISFGRTSQGGEALGAAVNAINRDKAFAPIGFGQTLSPEEQSMRDFYKLDRGERTKIIFGQGNDELKKRVLGEQYSSFQVGLQESSGTTAQFVKDVEGNRVAEQLRYLYEDPNAKQDAIDMRAKAKFDRHAREHPYMEMITPDAIENWSFRTSTTEEYERDANEFRGKGLGNKARGLNKERLDKALGPDKPIEVKVTNQPSEPYSGHIE